MYVAPAGILKTKAINTNEAGNVTLCVLTSRGDWLMCLWSLVSFFVFSRLRLPVLIYRDGTLSSSNREHINNVFPNAKVVEPANAEVCDRLAGFPNCLRFRSA